ncbi:hypothetical protein BJX65DRAFT_268113 [Aspergillus insuetus]
MNVKSQLLELCGITPASEASTSSIWDTKQTSDDMRSRFASIDSLLEIYVRGFTSTDSIADLPSRVRVDAILIMSLGIAKEKLVNSVGEEARTDMEERLERLFWSPNQFITVSEPSLSPCDIQYLALDYVLWFGDTRELQTNLVVLRAEEPLDEVVEKQYCSAALAATAMIHHCRAKQPVIQGTYGVVTDGLTWIFLYVNKEGEYSSVKLNWMEGNENAIVAIIGKILDQAVAVKMICEDAEVDRSLWSLGWSDMAKTWDSPRNDESEVDEIDSLETPADTPTLHPPPYISLKMEYLAEFKEGCKELLVQAAHRGENLEQRLEELYQTIKHKFQKKVSGDQGKVIESRAVTNINPSELFPMFQLRREENPPNYWRLNMWEVYDVSDHLKTTIQRIALVFGRAKQNEAAVRLFIDAVLLEVLTSVKEQAGQYEDTKGKKKRPSTDSTMSLKDIQMAVETDITYIFPTRQRRGVVDVKITGRMDYTMWYGQPREAETNLLVVEAKQSLGLNGGRYQAIAYMALIQHARAKAGRASIPIYGIATDSEDWDFIRMDGTGNVDVQQFNWKKTGGAHIVSLLRKVVREASALTPAPTRQLSRAQTVTGRTSLTLTNSDGTPL